MSQYMHCKRRVYNNNRFCLFLLSILCNGSGYVLAFENKNMLPLIVAYIGRVVVISTCDIVDQTVPYFHIPKKGSVKASLPAYSSTLQIQIVEINESIADIHNKISVRHTACKPAIPETQHQMTMLKVVLHKIL